MDKLEMIGNWNIVKGKLKQKFSILSDNDLNYVKGKEEELIGKLQKKLGKTRSDVVKIIKEGMKSRKK